ncbi:TrgA family protein [Wenxinia marina]|uniref:Tellurium resistance protein n=1 Tax=Wenxinia marina DSM 24838 TaxID=1123501 RepID=A0A0D0QEX2_9RHOB|nr:TrgA family protein [Wenxinia marina]KIQ69538.1 hypothetical protein Wenmar_01901 [Wenxinia marina DSM 24838]GGL59163.1 tellurium resistance protein [Wenxinia marina]
MPTAGRLAGALTFMALAFILTLLMVPLFPEGTVPRHFMQINVVAAMMAGWTTVGSRAGRGMVAAFGVGLTGVAVFGFWMFFLHGFGMMLKEAFRKAYDGPMEAIAAIFEMMARLGGMLLTPEVLMVMIAGSIVAGLVTEHFARNYR